jgi:uncharacterized protein
MRTARWRLAQIALLALSLSLPALGQTPPPELTAPVNDFANVINAQAEAELDSLIRKLQAASGDVIVVATVQTFQPAADIRMYANEMFENRGRGIGQKGRDNGMLVVLAVDDREVWAEVGYDLEGIITDGFAGDTSRQAMVPYFRKNDYGGGLLAGVTVFARRIAEARNVTLEGLPVQQPAAPTGGQFPFILVMFLVILAINMFRGIMNALTGGRRGRRRRRWGSMVGPFGAGYGGWHSGGRGWGGGGGFGGGFGGFGGGRSGGGGGGASW